MNTDKSCPADKIVGSSDGLADVVWRLNDIREMLLTQRIVGYGSLYGLDEWSTPIKNLDIAIEKLKRLAANAALSGWPRKDETETEK